MHGVRGLWYAVLTPLVSVVVPVRDDTAALAALLRHLSAVEPAILNSEIEVIVADAGRAGRMLPVPGVTWIEAPVGRGIQLNAGAARATGEWLWFLHADSRPPQQWLYAFRNLQSAPDAVIGGAFRFALDSSAWQARWLERAVALRVRLFNLPYGDQGIFVRRSVFVALGGFAPIPLMEDVEFIQRLKRRGRLRHLTLSLTTSARRWESEGWWRRSAGNLLTLIRYYLGVSPERLANSYYGEHRP
jgi:rSAM/selenodomain-associated transferase 2